jgi:hypothetical protein
MKDELQKINKKLDLILSEVQRLQNSNSPPGSEETFTIDEAAKKLNLSKSRVYALIYEGKLIPLQREKYSRIQFNQKILNQYQNGKH